MNGAQYNHQDCIELHVEECCLSSPFEVMVRHHKLVVYFLKLIFLSWSYFKLSRLVCFILLLVIFFSLTVLIQRRNVLISNE